MTRPATSNSAGATGTRLLQYEGFPLEAVLERVHAVHGTDATITAADRVRRGGVGGFFAREVFQVTVSVPPVDAVPDVAATEPADAADDPFDDIDPEDIDGALSLTGVPERSSADAEIWALVAAAAASSANANAPTQAPAPAPVAVVEPVADPTIDLTVGATEPEVDDHHDADVVALRPHRVRRSVAPPFRLEELLAEFETSVVASPALPTAGIVAVVGARPDAVLAAGRIATSLGVDPDLVLVAAPAAEIVIPTPDEAVRLAATTRFRCTPVAIIVVELVPGRDGHEWVRAVLDGLRPEQVRFAADTDRLLTTQHLSITALGGVDAVDMVGAAEHADPTAALELGAPIATIDGRPASPAMWAALVLANELRDGASAQSDGLGVNRSAMGAR